MYFILTEPGCLAKIVVDLSVLNVSGIDIVYRLGVQRIAGNVFDTLGSLIAKQSV